jgi:hypothetical protein
MVARSAAASEYRGKCKMPEKPILVGDPKESLSPLSATVQIREFLGASGFCWIWIPNYYLLAKPQSGENGTHYVERKKKGI